MRAVIASVAGILNGGLISGTVNSIGYTGHVMDASTGLTYMQQRYYDPAVGRFLSVDPVTASSINGGNFNRSGTRTTTL